MLAADEAAAEFGRLFQDVYLTFHRRDGRRNELPGASRAVLTHLSLAGPLTVGEAAQHLDRAQSVVSEIVAGLVAKGLLERRTDPADRRRALVWLSDDGIAELRRDANVLGLPELARAMTALTADELSQLLRGLRALVAAASPAPATRHPATRHPTTKETQS